MTRRRRAPRLPLMWPAALAAAMLPVPPARATPPPALARYAHRAWQEELPQTTVHALLTGRDGRLRFGTYNGLVTFDGARFTVLDAANTPRLPSNGVQALAEDGEGSLWIGTPAGLARLDGAGIALFGVAEGLPSAGITSVGLLPDGTVWAGTRAGAALLPAGASRFVPLASPAATTAAVNALQPAADGALQVCSDQGIWTVTASRTSAIPFPGAERVPCFALLDDGKGTLWAGTAEGILAGRDGRFAPDPALAAIPARPVQALLRDRTGALWAGTRESGVFRVEESGGRVSAFGARQGLSHNLVKSLAEDREGNVWVGTNAGLDQLRPSPITTHSSKSGLSDDFVRAIFEDASGTLWIGTDGGGVNRCRDGSCDALTAAAGLPGNSVRAIAQSPDGTLWFGGRNGIARLDARGGLSVVNRSDGLSSDRIRALLVDRRGTVWIGTEGGGLDVYRDGRFAPALPIAELPSPDVLGLHEDAAGRIWVGSLAGVTILEEGKPRRHVRVEDGLPAGNVFAFLDDGHDGMWIGTEAGLVSWRAGAIRALDTRQGLPDTHVYRILRDDFGHLWLTTNRGIARVSEPSLDAVVEGKATTVEAELFDTARGMPTLHCNGASHPAGWRTRDGHLWFPTTRGAVEIDPTHDVHNTVPPPVHLDEIAVDGVAAPATSITRLPPGRHDVEFRYAAASFRAPERVRFRYRLDGYDDDWVEAGGRRVAYYPRLPPGDYRFRVVAANDEGVWNTEGVTHPLFVAAVWWESTAARLGIVLLAAAMVLAFHRFRVRALARANRRLEEAVERRTAELAEKIRALEASERTAQEAQQRAVEANRAKSLFLSTMSHELRTPLNSIIGFSSVLMERLSDRVEPRLYRFLGNIQASGEHLLSLINDILDLSKIEAGRMELHLAPTSVPSLVEEVVRLLQGVAEKRGIPLETDCPGDLPILEVDATRIQQVLFNLVSNAVKFSADGSPVRIVARRVEAEASPLGLASIRLDVVDRGIGISEKDQKLIFEEFRQADGTAARRYEGTGLGLALVRRFLAMHGGTVSVQSAPGEGSTFSAYLPLGSGSAEPWPRRAKSAVEE